MPTNLLERIVELNNPLFRDANGELPIIAEVIRGRVTYTLADNADAQVCYRILLYEVSGRSANIYNRIIGHPSSASFRVDDIIIDRYSYMDYRTSVNRRIFKGLKFRIDVPTTGCWGRYVSQTTRTVSIVAGKITLNKILRVKNTITSLLNNYLSRESERNQTRRIEQEERIRVEEQLRMFMSGVIEHFPIHPDEGWSWRENNTRLALNLRIDKYQVGKIFEAIYNIRNMQTNPLDTEYLLKKDY
jgi:hypothetical protein